MVRQLIVGATHASPVLLLFACLCSFIGQPAIAETSVTKPAAKRLVSLAPSNTELIYTLGAEDQLLGVSTFCKFPTAATKKPKAGSFVSIDFERLTRIKPDIVLLVSGQEPLSIQLKKRGIKSITLRNKTLADIDKNLTSIGEICGKKERAKTLSEAYRKAISDLKNIVKDEPKPRIFLAVWPKPIITIGGDSFLNDVVTICGGNNVAATMPTSYPKYSPEKLISSNPDLVIMPYQARGTAIKDKPPWSLLAAIKKKRFFYLPDPDDDYLSRPTLRILNGLYWLTSRVHPSKDPALKQWLQGNQSLL